jgi:hypothetical protein
VGASTFDVSVGHIAGALDPALRSVSVAVRPSGAVRWTPLPVTPSGGVYHADFFARPRLEGHTMDLLVTATDAFGGVLRQSTERAFLVSA